MTPQKTYTILNTARVIAGPGSIASIMDVAADFGARRVLVVSDKGVARAGLVERPRRLLEAAGVHVDVVDDTPPEPEAGDVERIFAAAAPGAEMVIGIGGGSAMDVAKIVAVMLANPVSLRDLLGRKPIERRGVPTLMVPTTAGTGSEVTPNAIVLVPEDELKVGIVHPRLVPDAVILDPELTMTLPPAVTASTGMDALTHAIECFASRKGNPFSDLYGLKAIELVARSIRRAYRDGRDLDARHDMLLAAMYGGACIATSSTTAVHALAYPLGGKYRIAHGLSNAMLLPFVMEFNLDGSEERFRAMAQAMRLPVAGLSARAAGERLIAELHALNADLDIVPSLRDKGITDRDLDGLVDGAAKVTRLLDNNPRPMDRADMRAIYRKLL
jgi:alcohol dehydrogenase class IV